MDIDKVKIWPKGIPEDIRAEDYISQDEADLFARNKLTESIVIEFKNREIYLLGYATSPLKNVILEVDGTTVIIFTKCSLNSYTSYLSKEDIEVIINTGKEHGVDVLYYSPTSLRAIDFERRANNLALHGDKFYFNQLGLFLIQNNEQGKTITRDVFNPRRTKLINIWEIYNEN